MLAALAALAVGPAVGQADAAKPSLVLDLPSVRVNNSTDVGFAYKATHLLRGSRLYVQRQFGTRRVFENVVTLPHTAGYGAAPGLPVGRYAFRLAAYRGHKLVGTSSLTEVYSYGLISAATLCRAEDDIDFESDCDSGTIQVGGSVFPYASQSYSGNTGPDGDADVEATNSSCRAAAISYAVQNGDDSDAATVGANLTQSAADPQSTQTSVGSVGRLDASITSPDWDLIFWTDTGGPSVFWNAIFDCWTTTGEA